MLAEQDFIQNVAILNQDLRREAWYGTFWHHFVGEVKVINDPSGKPTSVETSDSPISRFNGFQGAGRDNMLIPFERDLTGPPVFGDTVAKGTGEAQSFYWSRTYINQTRKVVVAQAGKMSDLRARKLRLIENAKPKLVKWWSKYLNQEIYRALYEGLSSNISGSVAYDALGVFKRYHPNFYVNTGGNVTAVGTEKQFTTAGQLDSATEDTVMTVAILRKLRSKCLQLKIPRINTSKGFEFWVMVMHPDQVADLRGDSDFKDAVNSAFNGHRIEHPALNAAEFMIEGFAIFEDIVGIRCWDDANGGFYGDDDADPIASMFEPSVYSGSDNYCAIVFGQHALGIAVPEKLNFGEEIDDFKNIKEVAGMMIWGVSRADFVTEALASEDGSGMFEKNTTGGVVADTACLNDSSLILMTKRA